MYALAQTAANLNRSNKSTLKFVYFIVF